MHMQGTGKKSKVKVVGCFLEHDGRFLILRRSPEVNQGGEWGLPSGHVEPGETEADAVVREIREETGFSIPVEKLKFLKEVLIDYPGRIIDFFAYRVDLESKIEVILNSKDHQAHAWTTVKECYARNDLINGVHELLEKTGYISGDVAG